MPIAFGLVRGSRVVEPEPICEEVPAQSVADPNMKRRRVSLRIIETACHDINLTWLTITAIRQRRTASPAEAARDSLGGMKVRGCATRQDKVVGSKCDEWQCWRGCGSAAGSTMTDSTHDGLALHPVAQCSAKTTSLYNRLAHDSLILNWIKSRYQNRRCLLSPNPREAAQLGVRNNRKRRKKNPLVSSIFVGRPHFLAGWILMLSNRLRPPA